MQHFKEELDKNVEPLPGRLGVNGMQLSLLS